jgi:hypothetical protein
MTFKRWRDEKLSVIRNYWNKVELFVAHGWIGIGIDTQKARYTYG